MFWDTFEQLCKQAGKKPSPVGKEIGVSATAVSKWREGTIPNGEILLKIANYFNVSVDYLLDRKIHPEPSGEVVVKSRDAEIEFIHVPSVKSDTMKEEFIRAFDELSFADQVEIMHFTMQKLKR